MLCDSVVSHLLQLEMCYAIHVQKYSDHTWESLTWLKASIYRDLHADWLWKFLDSAYISTVLNAFDD